MAHRKLNKPEPSICRESPAWLKGCSSIFGLMRKKALERETSEANREKLTAADFLLPREPISPPKPRG
jgi:hypothetical protein